MSIAYLYSRSTSNCSVPLINFLFVHQAICACGHAHRCKKNWLATATYRKDFILFIPTWRFSVWKFLYKSFYYVGKFLFYFLLLGDFLKKSFYFTSSYWKIFGGSDFLRQDFYFISSFWGDFIFKTSFLLEDFLWRDFYFICSYWKVFCNKIHIDTVSIHNSCQRFLLLGAHDSLNTKL